MQKVKGDLYEIQHMLQHQDYKMKLEGMKRLISQMSAGKDYSGIFQVVIRCLEHPQIELKKLVYLYIINYSRKSPDDAIMVVNMFRKDIHQGTPLIKALALRTIGCLRVKQLNEYLIEPLVGQIDNQDAYVRKSAIICVGKVYAVNQELIETQGIIAKLQNLLHKESNANVLSSLLTVLIDISMIKGESVLQLDSQIIKKIMIALKECNEWNQIYILDCLANYNVQNQTEAEQICDRIVARLQHMNSSVVLGAIKVLLTMIDQVSEKMDFELCKKIEQPLMSLVNSENFEILFIVLRNIKSIYYKRPILLQNYEKMFFCKFNEPSYIKMEKLQILNLISNTKNSELILNELQEYAKDLDLDFVSAVIDSLQIIGKKSKKTCDMAIKVLINLYQNALENSQKIVEEVIISLHQLYRTNYYKNENSLSVIKDSIQNLTESKAKQAGLWIIGQFCNEIEGSTQILQKYLDSFLDEDVPVQLQILTSAVKLFVQNPSVGQDLILQKAQEEVSNPDVRDRAYMYWRLLSSDPQYTKNIVQQENTNQYQRETIEPQVLDQLIREIGFISSCSQMVSNKMFKTSQYQIFKCKPQDQKRAQIQASNLLDIDQDEEEVQQNNDQMYQGSFQLVVDKSQQGQKNNSGLEVQACIQQKQKDLILQLKLKNDSLFDISSFKIQLNNNYFNYYIVNQNQIQNLCLSQDQEQLIELQLKSNQTDNDQVYLINKAQIQYPFNLKFAIKSSLDLFYFTVNDIKINFLEPNGKVDNKTFKDLWKNIPETEEVKRTLQNRQNLDDIKQKLINYNLFYIAQRVNKQQTIYYFSCKDLSQNISLIELIIQDSSTCEIIIKSQNESFAKYLQSYLEDQVII